MKLVFFYFAGLNYFERNPSKRSLTSRWLVGAAGLRLPTGVSWPPWILKIKIKITVLIMFDNPIIGWHDPVSFGLTSSLASGNAHQMSCVLWPLLTTRRAPWHQEEDADWQVQSFFFCTISNICIFHLLQYFTLSLSNHLFIVSIYIGCLKRKILLHFVLVRCHQRQIETLVLSMFC